MAAVDQKISELTTLTIAAAGDYFAVVDIDESDVDDRTKKITLSDLMGSPGAIGSINPSSLDATSITLIITVDEFSTDGTLAGDSDSAIPTEKAVKTYVDAQVSGGAIVGNEALSSTDTTATITFGSPEADANYGVAWSLVNTTDDPPSIYAGTVFEKTTNGFSVIFSSPMDTNNYVLSWIVTR